MLKLQYRKVIFNKELSIMLKKILSGVLCLALIGGICMPLTANAAEPNTINAVATAHLDTVWSWDLEKTISEYLPGTYEENVDLMKDNPDYKFNFEGAYRYQLLKEYYPEKFEQLKQYVTNGQWNLSGTALENGDVNVPSPEALFRNVLYGNNYFLDNFGKTSKDIYLPDCFGFGYALPSIMAHSNLIGFSTQKLSWGNSFPNEKLPFDIGVWKGPDGSTALADINQNDYTRAYSSGLRANQETLTRLQNSPIKQITALFGSSGDRGGGTSNLAVQRIIAEQKTNASQNVKVRMAGTSDLMESLTAQDISKLSTYDGEMVMKQHGVGSYSSRVLTKRWNRQAEQLGYAAEVTNVASEYLGTTTYPKAELEAYWTRVIAHQFHDDITGTANATTYKRSYNDLMLSIKQFANEYQSGVSGVVRAMDTTAGAGEVAVVVNTPLAFETAGTVTGTVTMPTETADIKVRDNLGNVVPSQIISKNGNEYKIAFNASVKSLGYKKYIISGVASNSQTNPLTVTANSLSNEKYNVTINANGDISSIFDKELNKELLDTPLRLGIFTNTDQYWAAWELNMSDYAFKTPQNYVGGTPQTVITENGPAKVALKITRTYGKSTFEQTISLSAGGKMVEVDNKVDWQEKASLLKAEFNLAANNPNAVYDLGLGTITRGNNTANKAEVPVQKWADLTHSDQSFGVSIINDSKYGMDKYDNNTMRLTLIHTPRGNYSHHSGFYGSSGQDVQDIGENRFAFAIYGHSGNYANSDVVQLAEQFNQPLNAFQTDSHAGTLGSDYSFGGLNNNNVVIRAIKKAEKSNEIIVRVNEMSGSSQSGIQLSLGAGITSAREVYATEQSIGAATVQDGKLVFDMGRYAVKTFALTLADDGQTGTSLESTALTLPYNTDVYSSNADKDDTDMTYMKEAYPAELVPSTILSGGIQYSTGSKADAQNNAVRANGQTITLPSGYSNLKLLAVSTNGDKSAEFNIGGTSKTLKIADFSEHVALGDIKSLNITGYIKEQIPAFVATHRHTAGKDAIAKTTYMFKYELDVSGASSITLPNDKDIIIFAATLTKEQNKKAECVSALHDQRACTATVKSDISKGITFDGGDVGVALNNNFEEKNMSATSCDISTEQASSGTASLKLSGNDASPGESFTYYTLSTDPIKVKSDTVLSYKFYAGNALGRYANIDMYFETGDPLRDRNNAVDQNGVQMHPKNGRGTVGSWVEIKCNLGNYAAGETITRLMFAYDHPADQGNFAAYIDDLKITSPSDSLEYCVTEYEGITNTGYTDKSFGEFQYALNLGKAITLAPSATDYEIKSATALLTNAYAKLAPIIETATNAVYGKDYSELSGGATAQGDVLANIVDTSRVSFNALDFGVIGTDLIRFNYSAVDSRGSKDTRVIVYKGDTQAGEVLGTLYLPATGSADTYANATLKLKEKLVGQQTICMVFRSENGTFCNLNSLDFTVSMDDYNVEQADQAQKKIARIAKIFSAEQEVDIIDAEDFYNNLSSEQKAMVTNSAELETAKECIERIKLIKNARAYLADNSLGKSHANINTARIYEDSTSPTGYAFRGHLVAPNTAEMARTLQSNNFTYDAWVKFDNLNVGNTLFSKGDRLSTLKIGENGLQFFVYGDNSWTTADVSPAGWTTNEWCHITATYDKQNLKVYFNGELVQTVPCTKSVATSTFNFAVGRCLDKNAGFDGEFATARVFGKALSAAEISNLHKADKGESVTAITAADTRSVLWYDADMAYIAGDVDDDVDVDVNDAFEVLRAAVGVTTLPTLNGFAADYNNNKTIDAQDAFLILKSLK